MRIGLPQPDEKQKIMKRRQHRQDRAAPAAREPDRVQERDQAAGHVVPPRDFPLIVTYARHVLRLADPGADDEHVRLMTSSLTEIAAGGDEVADIGQV